MRSKGDTNPNHSSLNGILDCTLTAESPAQSQWLSAGQAQRMTLRLRHCRILYFQNTDWMTEAGLTHVTEWDGEQSVLQSVS